MNLLFTCAGRRGYLLSYFRKALPPQSRIIGTDLEASAPALAQADVVALMPPSYHPDYIPRLLALCQQQGVQALMSLHDLDAYILSGHRAVFEEIGVRREETGGWAPSGFRWCTMPKSCRCPAAAHPSAHGAGPAARGAGRSRADTALSAGYRIRHGCGERQAGMNLPMVDWLLGRETDARHLQYQGGMVMAKCEVVVCRDAESGV